MKKLRFLVSLMTKSNDFQMEQSASAETAARQLGVDLEIVFADNDAITQSTQVLKAIQVAPEFRPDAIIVEPVGGTALPQVARAAAAAGIGWAILNRDAEYIPELRRTSKLPFFSISVDHKEIGKIQGQQFCVLLPRGGAILYIQGPSENSAAKDRALGMQSTLRPDIQVTALRGQWTEESAYKSVTSWLKLNVTHKVNIHLIGAQNDAMAMGARKAFQDVGNEGEREQWLRLPITGVDGVPQTGQAWVRSNILRATVVVPPNAGTAITMLSQALQSGTGVPERSFMIPQSFPTLDKLTGKS
jgi:ABC-type sugar transport system substrate-binding protein